MTTPGQVKKQSPWIKRVGWLIVLWAAGVAALAAVVWLIRVFMNWAGFST